MIKRFRDLLIAKKSFAFETTASGINYLKHLKEARNYGYEVNLFFLWLSSEDLAIKRVAHRVAQGGHSIPEETIRRRYKSGIKNMVKFYLPIADNAIIMNNSLQDSQTMVIKKSNEDGTIILEPKIWEIIQRMAE